MLSKSMAPKFPIKDSNINSTVFFHYLCGYFPDCIQVVTTSGFPGGSVVKKNLLASTGDTRDAGLIPGSGRSAGG